MKRLTPRRGFTLTELLVVIAIIGILIACFLPAVQQARKSARASACRANLAQLGRACEAMRQSHGRFPGPVAGQLRWLPWCVQLLPFLEQTPLYERFDAEREIEEEPNVSLGRFQLVIFRCPSTPPAPVPPYDWGRGDWALNFGVAGKRRLLDGDSQSLTLFEPCGDATGWINSRLYYPSQQDAAGSRHATLHTLFGDSSVQRLSKTISSPILDALSTPDDGLVVTW